MEVTGTGSTLTVAGVTVPTGIGCRFAIDPFTDGNVVGGAPVTGIVDAESTFTGL